MRNFVRYLMAGNDTFLYFGYGSNLLKERIRINSPTAQFKAIGKLQDYKLSFHGPNWNRWGGGVATIEPTPGHTLWGVVWQISVENLEALNRFSVLFQFIMNVTKEDMILLDVSDVIAVLDKKEWTKYMEVILGGAKQNGLPEEYIKELSEIQTNDFKGPLKIMEDLKKNSTD